MFISQWLTSYLRSSFSAHSLFTRKSSCARKKKTNDYEANDTRHMQTRERAREKERKIRWARTTFNKLPLFHFAYFPLTVCVRHWDFGHNHHYRWNIDIIRFFPTLKAFRIRVNFHVYSLIRWAGQNLDCVQKIFSKNTENIDYRNIHTHTRKWWIDEKSFKCT